MKNFLKDPKSGFALCLRERKISGLLILGCMFIVGGLNSSQVLACSVDDPCSKIREIFKERKNQDYAVPFSKNADEEMTYTVDKLTLTGSCGNGYDAACEVNVYFDRNYKYSFSVPYDIRIIRIMNKVYLINGIRITKNSVAETNAYQVRLIGERDFKIICENPGVVK